MCVWRLAGGVWLALEAARANDRQDLHAHPLASRTIGQFEDDRTIDVSALRAALARWLRAFAGKPTFIVAKRACNQLSVFFFCAGRHSHERAEAGHTARDGLRCTPRRLPRSCWDSELCSGGIAKTTRAQLLLLPQTRSRSGSRPQ